MNILKKITVPVASYTIITICGLIIIYHTLIITRFIPYEYTWGGRLETVEQMYKFEAVSIIINIIFILSALIRVEAFPRITSGKVLCIMFFVFAIIFFINTVGNIFSESLWEAIIFTPITLILSTMSLRLSRK